MDLLNCYQIPGFTKAFGAIKVNLCPFFCFNIFLNGSSVLRDLNKVILLQCAQVDDWKSAKTIYEFSATDIDGNVVSLEKYR